MALSPQRLSTRDRLVLAGLYLSKFDVTGLRKLGFSGFAEAFNVIGFALGARAASVKNYRDEFDPLFPNPRKGWHKRPVRDYCLNLYNEYGGLDLEQFSSLVKSLFGCYEDLWSPVPGEQTFESESYFSRLATGLAAEQYFESEHPRVPEFHDCSVENTTRYGCGYDFRLRRGDAAEFLAVEVKGLKGRAGSLSLTTKEFDVAMELKDRFFLFVVKNFRERPMHEVFQNPLSCSALQFQKNERPIIQVSWIASVS
jgi:hypothetical protein